MTESQELFDDIAAVLAAKQLILVDLQVNRSHGALCQVRVIVYRPEGTGIDECAKAHRLVQPCLEAALGIDGFYLEVSSPGLDRTIRSDREYAIFSGRGVRLVLDDGSIVQGIIGVTMHEKVRIHVDGIERDVPYDTIRKGKLDYSQEGR
jgi:ribosome maturation factor RimP